MTCCAGHCAAAGFFDSRIADRDLRRYQRRGPDASTRLILTELRLWTLHDLTQALEYASKYLFVRVWRSRGHNAMHEPCNSVLPPAPLRAMPRLSARAGVLLSPAIRCRHQAGDGSSPRTTP